MERFQKKQIVEDLDRKLVLIAGPRQAGKTTLARSLYPADDCVYLNFDRASDRREIIAESWPRDKHVVVFDELHKMRQWKQWIKGIYDTEGNRPRLLITGSARLDVHRRGGESLAGRFHLHRLHPLSVAEAVKMLPNVDAAEAERRILSLGGFPEPFLANVALDAERWRRSHLDAILRQDLLDLEQVRDIKSIEILIDLLAARVGSPVSYASLARDLQVSPHTVKSWITILERLYVVFIVTPYSKKIARSILKEPKIYFYDTGRVEGGDRLENLVACALLKRNHYLEDSRGERRELHYLRDQQKREVDFLTLKNNSPEFLVEVKTTDDQPSEALVSFRRQLGKGVALQLVQNLKRERDVDGIMVRRTSAWLSGLDI